MHKSAVTTENVQPFTRFESELEGDRGIVVAEVFPTISVSKSVRSCLMAEVFGSPTDHDLDQLTGIFKLLSDKTRLNILVLLATGERNVSDLCVNLKLPQPTVSHHLGLLRLNNVILNRRAGKQVFYGLNCKVDPGNTALMISVQNYDLRVSRKV